MHYISNLPTIALTHRDKHDVAVTLPAGTVMAVIGRGKTHVSWSSKSKAATIESLKLMWLVDVPPIPGKTAGVEASRNRKGETVNA